MARRSVILLAALAVACGSEAEPAPSQTLHSQNALFTGRFEPSPSPPSTGDNSLKALLSRDDQPLTQARLEASAWMPVHGHGSHSTPVASEDGDGSYTISSLVYSMPGSWEVTVKVSTDTDSDSFVVPLTVE